VAVTDGLIVAVGPSVEGEATQVIDASDRVVTPGFVDIHTHYDGQVTWDDQMSPSSGHGVTTLVMGNCGVGFAPVRPGQEDWLIQLMEGVEDIPGTALAEGTSWGWEAFPEHSVVKLAHAQGVAPLELFYDLMLEDEGRPCTTTPGRATTSSARCSSIPSRCPGSPTEGRTAA
jgi:N-acyl-D-aspartate/D-glutamate deacylase